MDTLIIIAIFFGIVLFTVVAVELRERTREADAQPLADRDQATATTDAADGNGDGACCGTHLVCERDTLLQTNAQIEYFDDEELDALAGINPDHYTPQQHRMLEEVFTTLQERDVPAWVRSLQLRNILLPADLREQALLIVRERRQSAHQS